MAATSDSNKKLRWIRISALVLIPTLFILTVNRIDADSVKAPLLTMMGGVTIIIGLSPPRSITMPDIFTFAGTGIAIIGSVYWLISATQNSTINDSLWSYFLSVPLILLLFVYAVMSLRTVIDWKGVRREMRKIMRR